MKSLSWTTTATNACQKRGDCSVAAVAHSKSLCGAVWGLALDVRAWAFVRGTSALWHISQNRGASSTALGNALVLHRKRRKRLQKINHL